MNDQTKVSELAAGIITSPILSFAGELNARKAKGEKIHNLTIGDFDPEIYPIPEMLKQATIQAYADNLTNYPGAFGLNNLRRGIQKLIKHYCKVELAVENIQVASGSRPLIYSVFRSIIDKGDKVLYPVPSWNNDFYSMLAGGSAVEIETRAENNFMPSKEELLPHIKDAALLALCSPQNPTGTVLSKKQLTDICDLVVAENLRRADRQKPLYVMFDQVYWLLSFGEDVFFHAESINPAIHDYAIFIDGLSKSFAGTGVRVGWASGPAHIIDKMRTLIAHIGAWAPTPEQYAAGVFLQDLKAVDEYLADFKEKLKKNLNLLYAGFEAMRNQGLPVAAIKPEASIYLSVKIDLIGAKTPDAKSLLSADDIVQYLLDAAKVAILPFTWFGAKSHANWFRISIGTLAENAVDEILQNIESAITNIR